MRELTTDVLVVGGGLGGVAAALAALRLGQRVALTEATSWLGGQLTSQAVPPDEHGWIESTGCTASYRRLRENIRAYYRSVYRHPFWMTKTWLTKDAVEKNFDFVHG